VNVASIAGKEGNPMAAAYSASKAAVIALTKASYLRRAPPHASARARYSPSAT
jgi:NAD(P)-dependent dehydrogenase (short-subunit alcohol dehydrogenase family)